MIFFPFYFFLKGLKSLLGFTDGSYTGINWNGWKEGPSIQLKHIYCFSFIFPFFGSNFTNQLVFI